MSLRFPTLLPLLSYVYGKLTSPLLSLLVTPLYIYLLGLEYYALIGLYTTFGAFFALFDFGLGDTVCREISLAATSEKKGKELRSLVYTLEIFYWAIGGVVGLIIYGAAPSICHHWLREHSGSISLLPVMRLMAVALFFLWPSSFYTKSLQGLQAHATMNAFLCLNAVLRHVGALYLVWRFPYIETFFYWQLFCSLLHTALLRLVTQKNLAPYTTKPRFSLASLQGCWQFSLGMTWIGIMTTLLYQGDKILVSRLFSLDTLGLYSFSFTVASALYFLIHPLSAVYYPLFTRYAESRDLPALQRVYRTASQLLSLLLFPPASFLLFFSKEIVTLWTGNPALALQASPIISILSLGIMLHGCLQIPLSLQFAYGETRRLATATTLAVLVFFSTSPYIANKWGIEGIAFYFTLLHGIYLFFFIPRTHEKCMQGVSRHWYIAAVWAPLVAAVSTALLCSYRYQSHRPLYSLVFSFCSIGASVLLVTPLSRGWLSSHLLKLRLVKR